MIITERGFKKPADTDPYAVKDSNDNVDKLEEVLNAVDLEMDQLFQSVSNGKSLVAGAITDKGVNTSPTDTFAVMAGKIDAIVTDPSIGTTDAVAGDILLGKKVVSQGNLLIGTMSNHGPAEAETVNLTNHNQEYTIAQGSHSGLRKIKAVITNLAAGVIKAGVTVGGILGTFTSDATATAVQMLAGAKAYVNGVLVTGTIPSKTAQTYTPNTVNQSIAAVQYLSGAQTILGSANLVAGNIKKGVNIFNVVGTLAENNIAAHASNVFYETATTKYYESPASSAYLLGFTFTFGFNGTVNLYADIQATNQNCYLKFNLNSTLVKEISSVWQRNTYNVGQITVAPGDVLDVYVKNPSGYNTGYNIYSLKLYGTVNGHIKPLY